MSQLIIRNAFGKTRNPEHTRKLPVQALSKTRISNIQNEDNKHVGYPISITEDRIVARKSGIDQESLRNGSTLRNYAGPCVITQGYLSFP